MLKKIVVTICAAGFLSGAMAQQKSEFKLWPDSGKYCESELIDANFDKADNPFITVYLPPEKGPTPAVVICPGGAYMGLAIGHEGHQAAEWFIAQGFAAIVLKYRLPNGNYHLPCKDVQQAIETVRANAGKWNIDASKVGVIGFSAGGHLASTAATHFTSAANRPDFAMLIYPVITMDEKYTHGGSRMSLLGEEPSAGVVAAFSNELRVTDKTPPTFIAFCDDDDVVHPINGTLFYNALKMNSVPAEIHIYPTGGHGWGWLETFRYKDELRTSLSRWLSEQTAESQQTGRR